jgi:Skp family chaperone for outer membrane proteins
LHAADANFCTSSLSPSLMEQKPSSIEIPRPVFITKMSKKKLSLVAILLLSLAEFAVCNTRQRIAFVDLEARAEDEQRELEMGVEAGGSIPSHKKVEATNGKHKGLVGDYPEAFPEAPSALKELPKMKTWSPPIAAEEDRFATERKMSKEPKLLKKTKKLTESTTKSVQSESKKEGKRTKREKGRKSKKSSKGPDSPVSTSVPTSSESVPTISTPQTAPTNPPTAPMPATSKPSRTPPTADTSKGTSSPGQLPPTPEITPLPPSSAPSTPPLEIAPPEECDPLVDKCCSDSDCDGTQVCVSRSCLNLGNPRFTLTWYGGGKSSQRIRA